MNVFLDFSRILLKTKKDKSIYKDLIILPWVSKFFLCVIAIGFLPDVAAVYKPGSSPQVCETRHLLSSVICSVDMSVEVTTGVFDPRNYKVIFMIVSMFSWSFTFQWDFRIEYRRFKTKKHEQILKQYKSCPLQKNDPNWARRRKSEFLSFPGKIRSAATFWYIFLLPSKERRIQRESLHKVWRCKQGNGRQDPAQELKLEGVLIKIEIFRFTRTRSTEKGWWEKKEVENPDDDQQV